MLGGRPTEEWIARYSASHQNPVNRFCHTIGIPMIVASIALFAVGLWRTALVFFITMVISVVSLVASRRETVEY